jgi:hypothetical protein
MAQDLPVPQIGSFIASPDPTAGSPVTLTAAGVQDLNAGGTITQVAFYADSNGDGVLGAGDALLWFGTQTNASTWTSAPRSSPPARTICSPRPRTVMAS